MAEVLSVLYNTVVYVCEGGGGDEKEEKKERSQKGNR